MSNTSAVDVTITGMHCGGCVRRVTATLKDFGEPVTVEVGHAHLVMEDAPPLADLTADITAAIADLGFTVERVTAAAANDAAHG